MRGKWGLKRRRMRNGGGRGGSREAERWPTGGENSDRGHRHLLPGVVRRDLVAHVVQNLPRHLDEVSPRVLTNRRVVGGSC